MTSYYAEILGVILKIHPEEILYPNGKIHKSDKIIEIEKRAAIFFKNAHYGPIILNIEL